MRIKQWLRNRTKRGEKNQPKKQNGKLKGPIILFPALGVDSKLSCASTDSQRYKMATKFWCTGEVGRSSHSPSTQILMWMLPACRDTYIPSAFVEVGFLWSWKSGWRRKHLQLSCNKITIPTDYPLNQELGPFSLTVPAEPRCAFHLDWAESTCLQSQRCSSKGRMYCLLGSGWMVLTVFWVRWHHLELCLTWFPSTSVLWFLVCLRPPQFAEKKCSLQQGLETINKNSNLKCWSSPLGEAQWWEEEEFLAGVTCSAGRILECNHIVQQA